MDTFAHTKSGFCMCTCSAQLPPSANQTWNSWADGRPPHTCMHGWMNDRLHCAGVRRIHAFDVLLMLHLTL
jgi:hypothetical protein